MMNFRALTTVVVSLLTATPLYAEPCVAAPNGLVGWWTFESDASDALGHRDGALVGGPGFGPAAVGNGVILNTGAAGDPQWVRVPIERGFFSTAGFSVQLWANPQNGGTVFKANGPSDSAGVAFAFGGLYLYTDGWHQAGTLSPASGWSHIVITYDGRTVIAYVNGLQQLSADLPGFVEPDTYLGIGNDPVLASEGWRRFVGTIDEVQVYNRPLSATEASQLHEAGPAGVCRINVAGPTDDAVASFSVGANPSGPWSYGWRSADASSPFHLYDRYVTVAANVVGWGVLDPTMSRELQVTHNTTAVPVNERTIVHHPDLVDLHPGPNGERSILRWTSPAAGIYSIVGRFEGVDQVASTTDVAVVRNGTQTLFASDINGFAARQPFALTAAMGLGDTIEFSVGYGSNASHFNDTTGVAVSIVPAGDAVDAFSSAVNPNGSWMYGWRQARAASLVLYDQPRVLADGVHAWGSSDTTVSRELVVAHNSTAAPVSERTIVHKPDLLSVHPGPGAEESVVRWTAPATGNYRILGRFEGADTVGTTSSVAIQRNGVQLFTAELSGFGSVREFDMVAPISAGEHLDFSVDYGANLTYLFDTTGLAARITPVPGDVPRQQPQIQWNGPDPIAYGTPVGPKQLNALTDVAGSFTYTPPAGTLLNAGEQMLRVTFTPDDGTRYEQVSTTVSIDVVKARPLLTLDPGSTTSVVGEEVPIYAHLIVPGSAAASGVIDFVVDGMDPVAMIMLVESRYTVVYRSMLPVGTHEIVARYSGDSNLDAVQSAAVSTTINRASTSPTFSIVPASGSVHGQPLTLSASIAVTPPGAGTASGNVRFLDGATLLGIVPLQPSPTGGASASMAISSLGVGVHAFTAQYEGDSSFLPSGGSYDPYTIRAAQTTANLAASATTVGFGQPVTLSAVITPVQPGGGSPVGVVSFWDGTTLISQTTSRATASGAQAQLTTALTTAGVHQLSARFEGTTEFLASAGTVNVTVESPGTSTSTSVESSTNPALVGQMVQLKATVKSLAGRPTGMVTFYDGAATIGTATLTFVQGDMKAVVSTSFSSAGTHSITARYSGDQVFAASQTIAPLPQNVNSTPGSVVSTSTSITSSAQPSTYETPLTFTAVVSVHGNAAPADGFVEFVVDGQLIGKVFLAAASKNSSKASISNVTLSRGWHAVTATYNGSALYAPSRSATLYQEVK